MKTTSSTAQPFLKWAGGKRGILAEIHARLPSRFDTYYEPFVGGGAVFFSVAENINSAVLVDKNEELITSYEAVRAQPRELITMLREHDRKHSEAYFYRMRFSKPRKRLQIAARFIYLNKTCYNGLYRVNQSGDFNVPIGRYARPIIVDEENLFACSAALQSTKLFSGDFTLIRPRRGDFVYFDPPYHSANPSAFVQYTPERFDENEQARLRDFAVALHRKGVRVMISNARTDYIESLYREPWFRKHRVHAPRTLNSDPRRRGPVQELIITNYD